MTLTTWLLLGLCLGFVPNDKELTTRLCQATFEAKHREVPFNDEMDKFDREYFNYEMKRRI